MMTIAEFRATRATREETICFFEYQDIAHVYLGSDNWDDDGVLEESIFIIESKGKFYLRIANVEYSDSLENLEEILYGWCKVEGHLD